MAKRPGVVRHGTARALADNGQGYRANGESQHSRQSARPALLNSVSHMKGTDMTTTQEIECVPFDGYGKIVAPAPEIFAKLKKQEPEKFERLSAMLKANLEA